MVERKAFLANSKHQYRVSQSKEHDCSAQPQKEFIILWESKFVSFDRCTLIIREMVERKPFLAKSKHQYCVSQRGEHDCRAYNKMYGDYYENPSLTHIIDKLWL